MHHPSYPLFVFGFHGCDRATAESVLSGATTLQPSSNPYDWLGTGIYFWENAPQRALKWAQEQNHPEPYAIGAVIQLRTCFNLMDTTSAAQLHAAYQKTSDRLSHSGLTLPTNKGKHHALDMLIINMATLTAEQTGHTYDAVRGAFIEGHPVFPGSTIHSDTHIQLCVRNPACIHAYFRPKEL